MANKKVETVAVIRVLGKQYQVSENDELLVDLMSADKPAAIEVLAILEPGKTTLGKPTVEGAKVAFELLGEAREDKVRVAKYKAKSRYRKVIGFTPKKTKIKITKISFK